MFTLPSEAHFTLLLYCTEEGLQKILALHFSIVMPPNPAGPCLNHYPLFFFFTLFSIGVLGVVRIQHGLAWDCHFVYRARHHGR